jgi:hypothetical protein
MSQWNQGAKPISGNGTRTEEFVQHPGDGSDMAGGSGLSAVPGMLGKPFMLDLPELSSMLPTAKLPDARLATTIPVRERRHFPGM